MDVCFCACMCVCVCVCVCSYIDADKDIDTMHCKCWNNENMKTTVLQASLIWRD